MQHENTYSKVLPWYAVKPSLPNGSSVETKRTFGCHSMLVLGLSDRFGRVVEVCNTQTFKKPKTSCLPSSSRHIERLWHVRKYTSQFWQENIPCSFSSTATLQVEYTFKTSRVSYNFRRIESCWGADLTVELTKIDRALDSTHNITAWASMVDWVNGSQKQLLLGVGYRNEVLLGLIRFNRGILCDNCSRQTQGTERWSRNNRLTTSTSTWPTRTHVSKKQDQAEDSVIPIGNWR